MKTIEGIISKRRIKIYFFALLLLAGSLGVSAQTISPYLLGNNYWYNGASVAYVMQPGGLMQQAGFQTIRIGGFGPNTYTDDQYLEYIRRIKGMGAKPIVQVRATLTSQQAIDFIKKVNITNGLGVKVWSIGNEPDHVNGGSKTDAQIAEYTKRIASALKSVDPTITVIALEFSEYNAGRYATLIGGANSVTGLVPGKDYYYVDVVGFHRYVIKDVSEVIGSINDLIGKVNTANNSRPTGKKLMWGMGEFNSHYNNDKTTDPNLKVWCFNNGQFHAELYGTGMQKGAFSLDSWAMLEGEVERAGTDLSLFDKNYAGRSTYWHSLMLGQNMKANYLTSTDNQTIVAIVAMGDATGTAVMVINKSTTTGYDYSLNLNNATPAAKALTIKVNAGINKEITGNIGATTTQMLVFDTNGNLKKRYTYTKANADARTGAKIEDITIVNIPPTVTLTAPANNTSVNINTAVTCSATATDSDGTISKVDFYANGTFINSDNGSPYSITWTPTTAGTYAITAKATDNGGASTTSAAASVIVKETSTTVTLNPTADAYVRGGTYAATNFGTTADLYVKTAPEADGLYTRKAYLKFSVAGMTGIQNAVVRLYAGTAAAFSVKVNQTTDAWTEGAINWNNAPAAGTLIATTVITTAGKYYEWNVTSFVQSQAAGDGIVSLVFSDAATTNLQIIFNSKEAAANKPQLVVTSNGLKSADIESYEPKVASKDIKVYPNPVIENLIIDLNGNNFNRLMVVDLNGRIQKSMLINPGQSAININFSDYKQGIYFLRISNNKETIIRKIIKQ